MGENQDRPAEEPRKDPQQAGEPARTFDRTPRQGFLAAASGRLRQAVPHGVPGARPRPRFEFPPEVNAPAEASSGESSASGTPGNADDSARGMTAPIHFGFMFSVGVGFALLVFFILTNVGELLVWIGAALFIALGLDPIVRWLGARRIPRPAGIAITLLILAGIVASFFATLIPTIVRQTSEIISNAPGYVNTFLESDFFVNIDEQFHVRERIEEEVNKFFTNPDALGGVFGGVLSVGTVIANGLFGALIILVLTLYFLSSLPSMKMWAYRLAPRSRRRRVESLSEEITSSVGNYVFGQAIVAVLDASYAFIVMSIAGVPFSVLLAFVVALLAFIPLVGPPIALILVSLVALTVSWQTAVVFALFYLAYLQFEAYFVSPRIMQRAVAVPGAVAVIAVIAGGTLLGVLGALIAIPTAAAVLLLLKDVFISRQDHR
ncbi:AI-2E family transporter [Arthrobacter sp. zg-Y820]|uniref:AI-2E family transporter n=1 Tax=unclassified Arthrobacter TaxID=235627 RepID=UPI001E3A083E|nr:MULTISPECIES: AI-2E family transporter [unclassified Arthrobacter]MCC9196107.1 AI-2E family transporter [Arthrobacter sp. zg-Y820]MDK1278966.1 AI-2E family transporter [Arthrobacter sp. zg.Y820]MDK1359418.1 AI-2E family transporter [Arthrobacter sp. zg-Y1219]WIB08621.1 AI-2E family transporter [Arthrobacter sp. zg-Y820]